MTTATHPATFTSAQVCRQTGLSYRQLHHYCLRGYLRPQRLIRSSGKLVFDGGTGHDFVFPQAELDIARMMARLVALGVTAGCAAVVARDPQQRWRWLADVMAACKAMDP
jgi:hypothetical protein